MTVTRLIVLALAAATCMLLLAAQLAPAPEVIHAGRFEVVRGDRVLASLDADERGGVLRLFNSTGWETFTLRAAENGDGLLVLRDRAGAQRLALRSSEGGGQIMLFTGDEDGPARIIGPASDVPEERAAEPGPPLEPAPDLGDPNQTVELAIASLKQAIHQLEQRQLELQAEVRALGQIAPDSPVGDTRGTIEDLSRELRDQSSAVQRLEQTIRGQSSEIDSLRRQVRDLERRVR